MSRAPHRRRRVLRAVVAALALCVGPTVAARRPRAQGGAGRDRIALHQYVGMWVTPDGRIRQELRPDGRYDEARGERRSAYQGRYEVSGTRIEYWDDTGFAADGVFVGPDELHHGGMVFRRER